MKCDVLRWRWAPSTADEAATSFEAGISASYRELSQFQLSGMPLAYPALFAEEQRAERRHSNVQHTTVEQKATDRRWH